ncbi:hypothetical protein ABFS82_14G113100 [Erythranthe guttata]|nr:PREDICTED: BURP domain-containing protein 17 [Erythranthe guttata]|eukprot:XP_012830964.1 PREDICTED: BURP domain-containing protein 17 [Erythranthe guttata]
MMNPPFLILSSVPRLIETSITFISSRKYHMFGTVLFVMLFLQCIQTTQSHRRNIVDEKNDDDDSNRHLPIELNVFFHYEDLRLGNKMPIYFPTNDPSTTPQLLSKPESDSIPFSSFQLPQILQLFSFQEGSKQALAMQSTLRHCEFPAMKGESKFCATSLESMLDSVTKILATKFKSVTTNYLSEPIPLLQNYTITEIVTEQTVGKTVVACHTLPYPYAVFYCHGQVSDNKIYKVLLAGEDGGRVAAAAICHLDTSQWNADHVAFRVLRTVPGDSPVCHFFPPDNLVWIPLSQGEK